MNTMMERFVILIFSLAVFDVQNALGIEIPPEDPYANCDCEWTEWMNHPLENSPDFRGDNNSFAALRLHYDFCNKPINIECRSKTNPQIPFEFVKPEEGECDVTSGLVCVSRPKNKSSSQKPFYCDDYELRVYCCDCPEAPTTGNPINLLLYTIRSTAASDTTQNTTMEGTTPDTSQPFGLPISIIIVIVAAIVLVLGIVLCVVLTHKDRKVPKFSHHYMQGDSYLQRPVSFTEVDLMRSDSTSSVASSKSASSKTSSELRAYRFTELSKAKLEFAQAEQDDQPDVVSSTKRTNHEPILRHMSGERRWLPDEFEQQRRELLPVKGGKKSLFSRAVPPPVPPPPPIKKSVAFPDSSK